MSSDTNPDTLGNLGACLYKIGNEFLLNSGLAGANVTQWKFSWNGGIKWRFRTDWSNWIAWQ